MSQPAPTSAEIRQVQHVRWSDIPSETVNPLFDRQIVVGSGIMVARIVLKKGCVVPRHSHVHEQVSHVQQGSLKFTLDDGEITVRADEILCIPPHVPHAALALEDTICIDVFTPPREDWLNKTDDYLRT